MNQLVQNENRNESIGTIFSPSVFGSEGQTVPRIRAFCTYLSNGTSITSFPQISQNGRTLHSKHNTFKKEIKWYI